MREHEDSQVINVKSVAVAYVKIWLLEMPLPEWRCEQDLRPNTIVRILFNSKCEVEREREKWRSSHEMA